MKIEIGRGKLKIVRKRKNRGRERRTGRIIVKEIDREGKFGREWEAKRRYKRKVSIENKKR